MQVDVERLKEDTRGRWYSLFRHFGIEVGDGKHRACPVCGGKDRFRFDDINGTGSYICNQCGAGQGFGLLMKVLNIDFIEACKEVQKVVGTVEKTKVKPEKKAGPEKLRKVFKSSKPAKDGDPVSTYLQNRGIEKLPKMLRYGKTWEYETKQDQDAMLAVFSLPDGEAVTIHRTFIKDGQKLDIESPRKVMPPLKKMTGGAVRLYEQADEMGIAEGIETAISASIMYEMPVWAAISATLLENWEPPTGIRRIWVFADNDTETFTGLKAAYSLANRLAVSGQLVWVEVPKKEGDFNDMLRRGG